MELEVYEERFLFRSASDWLLSLPNHFCCKPSTTSPNFSPEVGFVTDSFAPISFALTRSSSRVDEENTITGVRASFDFIPEGPGVSR
jgi:hypothetical protein